MARQNYGGRRAAAREFAPVPCGTGCDERNNDIMTETTTAPSEGWATAVDR